MSDTKLNAIKIDEWTIVNLRTISGSRGVRDRKVQFILISGTKVPILCTLTLYFLPPSVLQFLKFKFTSILVPHMSNTSSTVVGVLVPPV